MQNNSSKIAIVDDYMPVAEVIAAYIRGMGCTPVVFTNPLEFLDVLKEAGLTTIC